MVNRQPWMCQGTIKNGTKCWHRLGFYDADKMSLDDLKGILQIQCRRCKSREGNPELTIAEAT